MIEKIYDYLKDAISRNVFPGCAVAIVNDGKSKLLTLGNYTYDPASCPVNDDSIYDIASITKAIPVSSLALKLIEIGKLDLNDKLIKYVPEFNGSFKELITVYHLLTQTLSFSFRLSECKSLPSEEIMNKILNVQLNAEPGTIYSYANATSILLGIIIERVCNQNLEQAARAYFFDPLEMQMTSFYPEKFVNEHIVPTEIDEWRNGIVQGVVHDESAYALRPRIVGSAGLFSTIKDLSHFAEMLINDGLWNGKQILKSETIQSIYQNQLSIGKNITNIGLGWELNQPETMGRHPNQNIYGKTGFTGCSIAINPSKKSGYILLSNHLFPKRRSDRKAINQIRRSLSEMVLK